MDEKTQQRVFEPFFTTKMDVGTGLGLATARSTMGRWGGKIELESELGKGTVFTLYLPIWRDEVGDVAPSSATRTAPEAVRRSG